MDKAMIRISFILFIIFSYFGASSAFANTISGTFTLPTGMTASDEGVTIIVEGRTLESSVFGGDLVTIPSGESSTNYSMQFSDDVERSIFFQCYVGCDSLGITSTGGWDNIEGIVPPGAAQKFSGSIDHVANIELEVADTFSGTISMPTKLNAKGGETLVVFVLSKDRFKKRFYTATETVKANQNFVDFSIGVPRKGTTSSWDVRFACINCEDTVESKIHYPTTNVGGTATLDEGLAFVFSKISDYRDLNLILLDSSQRKPKISSMLGSIFLLLERN